MIYILKPADKCFLKMNFYHIIFKSFFENSLLKSLPKMEMSFKYVTES